MNASATAQHDWRALLNNAIAAADITTVADRMEISRTYVSRVNSGSIKAEEVSDKFIKRVLETFDCFACPHLGTDVTRSACKTFALREVPTSSAREARHWRACQSCPNKHLHERE